MSAYASSEGSDEPAHPGKIVSAFMILLTAHIRPSANKDSNCWGQDISKSISKSMANTSLSSCIFKTMGSKENKLKISW